MVSRFKKFGLNHLLLLLITVVLGCGGLIAIRVNFNQVDMESDWLMLGRNPQHQHYAPYNVAPPLEIVWKKRISSVVADHALAMGDYLFLAARNGIFYILDYQRGMAIGDGKIGPGLDHLPAIHRNLVFFGLSLGKNNLVCFDLNQAKPFYTVEYPPITTAPLYQDGKLFFGTETGEFFAASAQTGKEVWRFRAANPIHSSPAYLDQAVYFADDKGWVYALDASSGIELWKQQLDGNTFSHPVLDDSTLFIGTTSGLVYALDLYRKGKVNWQQKLEGSIFGSPSLFGAFLYIGTNGHKVAALRKRDGEIVWQFETYGVVNTAPLASPDYLYVACWDKHLYVLNRRSGQEIFNHEFKYPLKSAPIIYRDFLLVHEANRYFYALANERYLEERGGEK